MKELVLKVNIVKVNSIKRCYIEKVVLKFNIPKSTLSQLN